MNTMIYKDEQKMNVFIEVDDTGVEFHGFG
jgi:hypothetical protein